jgi:hypothetical protein
MKLNMTNGRASAVLTGVLLLSLVGFARAALVEGFESGAFSGSEATSGDVGIRGTYFTIVPTQGTKQMLMTTINSVNDGSSSQSGTNAVSVTTIGSFLGISTSSIHDGTAFGSEGSAFTISLGALNVGDVITFDYDFLTQEDPTGAHRNDFAFWELNSGTIHIFADVNSSSLHPTDASNTVFGLETGYAGHTVSISITSAGTYTLGIGVMDATSTDNPSGVLIDNIQVTAVPEPTTIAFSIAGAALMVALRRRIKKTS